MNITKLNESLKNLSPQKKLEILGSRLKREKAEKDREKILLFIKEAEQEQREIEETLRNLERTVKEPEEKPLENIVQQEQPPEENQKKKQEEIQHLYGHQDLRFKEEEKNHKYQATQETPTQERGQSFILNESQRLEKERKKYETGRSE